MEKMQSNHDQGHMCWGNQPASWPGLRQSQVLRESLGKPLDRVCDTSECLDSWLPGTLAALPVRCHLVAPVARTAEGAIQVDTQSMSTSPLHKTLIHICVIQKATWHGRVLRAVPPHKL